MHNQPTAFAGCSIAPLRLKGGHGASVSERRAHVSSVTMDAASTKKKKVAPVVFATDLKGKPVWKLRVATAEDLSPTSELFEILPEAMISRYLEGGTVLCEGTIKGAKETEGYKQRIFGAALVSIGDRKKDPKDSASAWVKYGEVIGVKVHEDMPGSDDVKQQLTLGALKNLKNKGVASVRYVVPEESASYISELREMGFSKAKGKQDSECVELVANLGTLNPSPNRKVE